MSKMMFITLVEPIKFEDRTIRIRDQFPYLRTKLHQGTYIPLHGQKKAKSELHYVGVDGEEEIYIPARYSVLSKEEIPLEDRNILDVIQRQRMCKVQDYYKFVNNKLGIDMKKNHVMQVNPDPYKELDLKVPKGHDDKEK